MVQTAERHDDRIPLRVSVDLSSVDVRTPAQNGVTENVSSHGARIVTTQPLRPNDKVNVRSLRGTFRSRARVVYCEPLGRGSFAVGVQLVAATGSWEFPRKPGK
jgi:PilZ domain